MHGFRDNCHCVIIVVPKSTSLHFVKRTKWRFIFDVQPGARSLIGGGVFLFTSRMIDNGLFYLCFFFCVVRRRPTRLIYDPLSLKTCKTGRRTSGQKYTVSTIVVPLLFCWSATFLNRSRSGYDTLRRSARVKSRVAKIALFIILLRFAEHTKTFISDDREAERRVRFDKGVELKFVITLFGQRVNRSFVTRRARWTTPNVVGLRFQLFCFVIVLVLDHFFFLNLPTYVVFSRWFTKLNL